MISLNLIFCLFACSTIPFSSPGESPVSLKIAIDRGSANGFSTQAIPDTATHIKVLITGGSLLAPRTALIPLKPKGSGVQTYNYDTWLPWGKKMIKVAATDGIKELAANQKEVHVGQTTLRLALNITLELEDILEVFNFSLIKAFDGPVQLKVLIKGEGIEKDQVIERVINLKRHAGGVSIPGLPPGAKNIEVFAIIDGKEVKLQDLNVDVLPDLQPAPEPIDIFEELTPEITKLLPPPIVPDPLIPPVIPIEPDPTTPITPELPDKGVVIDPGLVDDPDPVTQAAPQPKIDFLRVLKAEEESLTFAWNATTDVTAFNIYLDGFSMGKNLPLNGYKLSNLIAETGYKFEVEGISPTGTTERLSILAKTLPLSNPITEDVFGIPKNFKILKSTPEELILSWDGPSGYKSFNIYLDNVLKAEKFPVGTYTFKGLNPEEVYFVNVSAIFDDGSISDPGLSSFEIRLPKAEPVLTGSPIVPEILPPPPPGDIDITSVSPGNGTVGDVVTVVGVGFTTTPGVAFGAAAATVLTATDTQVQFLVPFDGFSGPITITSSNGTINTPSFTVNRSQVQANDVGYF